jgi:hypothetical protein
MSILASIAETIGSTINPLISRIKNLEIRMGSAEVAIVNLGGQQPPPTGDFTIEPVTWTNLTEIDLSGEKLLNTDFSNTYIQYVADPENDGSSRGGGINPVKLIALTDISLRGTIIPQGTLLHGVGGGGSANELIRMEDPDDPRDYPYTASNQWTGTWDWEPWADRGTTWEFAKEENLPTNWSVSSSTPLDQDKLAQGIIKGDGGAVSIQQMFSNPIAIGTKLVAKVTRTDPNINGVVHVKTLRANESPYGVERNITFADGYVEFEATELTYGLRFSTAHGTREISSISLFKGEVSGGSVQTFTGGSVEKISGVDGYNAGASSVQKIDGQSNGYVQFQIGTPNKSVRVGLVGIDSDFEVDPPFQMNFGGGTIDLYSPWLSNYATYESGDWFRIRHYSANNQIHFQKKQNVLDSNGVLLGQDYVTFYTHPTFSNGNDLYFDISFHTIGSRLNDVQIAT